MTYTPFFLTGAPKSGTTWLGRMLDAHPQIACKGEARVHHFGLELVKAARGYNELLARTRQAVTEANAFPDLPWEDVMALMRQFIALRLRTVATPPKPGLRFAGEKDPEHAMHFATLDQLFPEAKFIHIIRDGRGVFISAWHHNVRSKDPNLERLGFDDFLEITAKEWAGRVVRGRETGRALGNRYFEVRYEDLVAEPERFLKGVLDFLGADADPANLRDCTAAASFEQLSKGRKAGEEDAASFFRKGDPDDWKTQLSAAQVQRFGVLAGAVLRAFGYSA